MSRDGEWLHIYSDDLSRELAAHPVTWSRKDSFCDDQYADMQPAELPTAPWRPSSPSWSPRRESPGSTSSTSREALAMDEAKDTAVICRCVSAHAASLGVAIAPEELAELAVRHDMELARSLRLTPCSPIWRTSATTR